LNITDCQAISDSKTKIPTICHSSQLLQLLLTLPTVISHRNHKLHVHSQS